MTHGGSYVNAAHALANLAAHASSVQVTHLLPAYYLLQMHCNRSHCIGSLSRHIALAWLHLHGIQQQRCAGNAD